PGQAGGAEPGPRPGRPEPGAGSAAAPSWPAGPSGPAAVPPRPARRSASSRVLTRCDSSAAAFLVKVRPRIRLGRAMPLATSQTSRAAMVSLLPDPAPAITAIGPGVAEITAACSAVGSVT